MFLKFLCILAFFLCNIQALFAYGTDTSGCPLAAVFARTWALHHEGVVVNNTVQEYSQDQHFDKALFVAGSGVVNITSGATVKFQGSIFLFDDAEIHVQEGSKLEVSPGSIASIQVPGWTLAFDSAKGYLYSGSSFFFNTHDPLFQLCGKASLDISDGANLNVLPDPSKDFQSLSAYLSGKSSLTGFIPSISTETPFLLGLVQSEKSSATLRYPSVKLDPNVDIQIVYNIPDGSKNTAHPLVVPEWNSSSQDTQELRYKDDSSKVELKTDIDPKISVSRSIVQVGSKSQVTVADGSAFDLLVMESNVEQEGMHYQDMNMGKVEGTMHIGNNALISQDHGFTLKALHLHVNADNTFISNSSLTTLLAGSTMSTALNSNVISDGIPWVLSTNSLSRASVVSVSVSSSIVFDGSSRISCDLFINSGASVTLEKDSQLCSPGGKNNLTQDVYIQDLGVLKYFSQDNACLEKMTNNLNLNGKGYVIQSNFETPQDRGEYTGQANITGWATVFSSSDMSASLSSKYFYNNDTKPKFQETSSLTVSSNETTLSRPSKMLLMQSKDNLFCGEWKAEIFVNVEEIQYLFTADFDQVKPKCSYPPNPDKPTKPNKKIKAWVWFTIGGGSIAVALALVVIAAFVYKKRVGSRTYSPI